MPVELSTIPKYFLNYDTDSGIYALPKRGDFLMLLFLKPHKTAGICALNLFTTLRRATTEKVKYYNGAIGEVFNVDITKIL
jgi:hypothetical protein